MIKVKILTDLKDDGLCYYKGELRFLSEDKAQYFIDNEWGIVGESINTESIPKIGSDVVLELENLNQNTSEGF